MVLSVYRRVCLVYDAPIKIFAVLCCILQGSHVKEAALKSILLHILLHRAVKKCQRIDSQMFRWTFLFVAHLQEAQL